MIYKWQLRPRAYRLPCFPRHRGNSVFRVTALWTFPAAGIVQMRYRVTEQVKEWDGFLVWKSFSLLSNPPERDPADCVPTPHVVVVVGLVHVSHPWGYAVELLMPVRSKVKFQTKWVKGSTPWARFFMLMICPLAPKKKPEREAIRRFKKGNSSFLQTDRGMRDLTSAFTISY